LGERKANMTESELKIVIVGIVDIAGFCKACKGKSDLETFKVLDKYYRLVNDIVTSVNGTTVKSMGDCILVMFPQSTAKEAVNALREVSSKASEFWQKFDTKCKAVIKAHVGPVVIGNMAPHNRLDLIGNTINQLFRMSSDGPDFSDELIQLINE
jgi:class 3 adenylate cyclase